MPKTIPYTGFWMLTALAACGQPEVQNTTPTSVGYVANQVQQFSAVVTVNENTIESVNAIVSSGVHAMTLSGGQHRANVALTNCVANNSSTLELSGQEVSPPGGSGWVRSLWRQCYTLLR